MPAQNTPLLSSAFSPRHRALEVWATFLSSCPFCPTNLAAANMKQGLTVLCTGQIWNKKRVPIWKRWQSNASCSLPNPEVTAKCFTLSSFPRAPLSLVVFPCVSTAITRVGFGLVSPQGNTDMPSVTATANGQKGELLNVQKGGTEWQKAYIYKENEELLTTYFRTA